MYAHIWHFWPPSPLVCKSTADLYYCIRFTLSTFIIFSISSHTLWTPPKQEPHCQTTCCSKTGATPSFSIQPSELIQLAIFRHFGVRPFRLGGFLTSSWEILGEGGTKEKLRQIASRVGAVKGERGRRMIWPCRRMQRSLCDLTSGAFSTGGLTYIMSSM